MWKAAHRWKSAYVWTLAYMWKSAHRWKSVVRATWCWSYDYSLSRHELPERIECVDYHTTTRARPQAMHMNGKPPRDTVALLTSGGLDSCILLGHLLKLGRTVQPVYILTGVGWQEEELTAVRQYTDALRSPRLRDLVALELPLDDLYGGHWSITGQGVPPEDTPDEAVYLPGRNPLLLVKAAVWCQMHGIEELAIAPLASNPFPDATDEFFTVFARAISLAGDVPLRITRPFAEMTKREVMGMGRDYPLEHSFSCIAPADSLHCGRCNKCDERKTAFKQAGLTDPTRYASQVPGVPHQRVLL